MKPLASGRIFICIWCIIELQVDGYLNLISNYDVPSVYQRTAELLCKVESDKIVKEVIWYKLSDSAPKKIVYYFEPPRFNSSGPGYKNHATLGKDQSSLVFRSVTRDDEGTYECHVAVAYNTTISREEIPEEKSVNMKLLVYVPPSDVKLNTFASGKNLTLTCRSTRSSPPADISWIVTNNGQSKEMQSAKIVSEITDNLADTIGYFYMTLSHKQQGTTVTCIISHPDTNTVLSRNITMTAPSLLHSVDMEFDWLGGDAPYSSYELQNSEDVTDLPPGLVTMIVAPSRTVEPNSSIILSMTSEGAFPEPSYVWWSEELDLQSGRIIKIERLSKNQVLFCLIENPVGRVVMSVQLTAKNPDVGITETHDGSATEESDIAVSGAVVAAIAFGALALLFLLAFVIYYFAFKRTSDKPSSAEGMERGEFDSYVVKQKPLFSSRTPGGQTKVVEDDRAGIVPTTEKESLLRNAEDASPASFRLGDSPTTPKKHRIDYTDSQSLTSTSTSGYGDDGGVKNGFENQPGGPEEPDAKERAITKHLHDFDENASFVGEYGSSFGLDGADPPDVVEMESRESPFDRPTSETSDVESIESGSSVVEGRYTLPHRDSGSWEDIDPRQTVTVHTPV